MIEAREKQTVNIERKTSAALQEMRKIAGDKQFRDKPDSVKWAKFNQTIEELLNLANRTISDKEERTRICEALWERIKTEGEKLNLFQGPEEFENLKTGLLHEVATGVVFEKLYGDKYRHGTPQEDAVDGCDYMLIVDGQTGDEKCIQLKSTRDSGQKEGWVTIRPGGYKQTVELIYSDPKKFFDTSSGMPTKRYFNQLSAEMQNSGLAN